MSKDHGPMYILYKLNYAKTCLDAHPEEEPRLRLFVQWLYGEAMVDEVVARLPVLTKPPAANPNQMDLFKEAT